LSRQDALEHGAECRTARFTPNRRSSNQLVGIEAAGRNVDQWR